MGRKKYLYYCYKCGRDIPATYCDSCQIETDGAMKKKRIEPIKHEQMNLTFVWPPEKKRKKKLIFVFGSNLAGIHGKGSALKAKEKYGAIQGTGKGRTGNAYGIPTKDKNFKVLSLKRIQYYVNQFFHYAYDHPEFNYKVVKIGCGLAGYNESDIRPMFRGFQYLKHVKLPEGWE